ncbi:MAG TPA: filamentous hemagglutinin N-terminal domain-containing protein [Acetobacteraceae bacterium]|nr:filamentous hemagglutinin N-terminal domain-containing protein [Acetobacteraceae bacterium]
MAKSRRRTQQSTSRDMLAALPRVRLSRARLCAGTALQAASLLLLAPQVAAQPAPNTRPSGGQVVAGSATIGGNASTTLINQRSGSAIINWGSYNVGSAQTVQYAQPNAQSITLNRVLSAQPSQIAGHIIANGRIAIVNQSGVFFYRGATVDTAGLVVSAAGITNQDFMAGRMVFSQAPNPGATVSNAGNITIRQAGLAALVAPQVANSGVISAQLGRVVLGGAATFALDMNGDGLVALNVTGEVTQVQIGNAKVPALVTNIGTILAPGGTVVLTAAAADGLVQKIISAGGTIAAPTQGATTGRVLVSGVGGDVEIDGTVSAVGTATGTRGGQIEVSSDHNVTVAAGATVDASGAAGGGLVAIGTTATYAATAPYGQASLTAANTTIAAGASVRANALQSGHGGRIAVAATNANLVDAVVSAHGVGAGGNGGDVLLIGRGLVVNATPDVSAAAGAKGIVLLPVTGDTTICDSGCTISYATFFKNALASKGTFTVVNGSLTFDPSADSTTSESINFATMGGGKQPFAGDIVINSGTDLVAASIDASAAGSLIVLGTLQSTSGVMSLTAGSLLAPGAGDVITEDGESGGNTPQSPSGTILADSLALTAKNGNIELDQSTNQITTLLSATADGTLTLIDNAALTIAGAVSATNVSITTTLAAGTGSRDITDNGSITGSATNGEIILDSAGNLAINNVLTAGTKTVGGFIDLVAENGDITEGAGGGINVVLLQAAASSTAAGSGNVSLTNAAGNTIGFLVDGSAAGDFLLDSGQALNVQGDITSGTLTGSLSTLGLQAPTLNLLLGTDGQTYSLASNGGTIALAADHYSLDGFVDANVIGTSGTGEVAFDVFTKGNTLSLATGGNFGKLGFGTLSAGTLVLGSTTHATGNTGSLNINQSLPGTTGITTLGIYSTGNISEAANTSIAVANLFGAADGNISLLNTGTGTNQIDTIAAPGLIGNAGVDLVDNNALTVAGNVAGANVTLRTLGSLTENAGTAIDATSASGSVIIVANSGDISLLGTTMAGTLGGGGYSGSVLLLAEAGDITETAAGSATASGAILTGTLAANAVAGGQTAGAIDLEGANQIASVTIGSLSNGGVTLAGLTATGNVTLDDAQSLVLTNATVGGSTTANVTIDLSAGSLTQQGGTILAGASLGAVSLTALNGIAIGGAVQAGSNTSGVYDGNLALTAGGTGVNANLTESAAGTLLAGTLQADATGDVGLGTAAGTPLNQIATLTQGSAGGSFLLTNATDLTVSGPVSAGSAEIAGDTMLLLEVAAPGTLTLDSTANLTSDPTGSLGTIGLRADNFALAGVLNAGTQGEIAFDVFTQNGELLIGPNDNFGSNGFGNFTAGTLVLGGLNDMPGRTGTLVIATTLSIAADLGLFSNGAILEQPSGSITATSLYGEAAGNISLTSNAAGTVNEIGAIIAAGDGKGLVSTGGALDFADSSGLALGAGATLSAGGGDLSLLLAGDFAEAATGLVAATATNGLVLIDSTGGNIDLAGTVQAGNAGGGTLALSAASGDITAGGTLLAGTLAADAAAGIAITGTTNNVAAIDQVAIDNAALGLAFTLQGLTAGTGAASLRDDASLTLTNAQVSGTSVAIDLIDDTGALAGSLTQNGGLMSATGATGALALQAISFAQQNGAVAQTAGGDISVTGGVSQAGGSSLAGDNLTIDGALTQNGSSINTGGDILVTGSVSQTHGVLAAGGTLTITGASVIQTQNSQITAADAAYLLLGISPPAPGDVPAPAGFSQDASSVIATAAGPLVIDTAAGDIDFAGTLRAGTLNGSAYTGTLALISEAGSINGPGTALAGTLGGSAFGSLLLTGGNNIIAAVTPLTLTDNAEGYSRKLAGLAAVGQLTLNDASTVGLDATGGTITGGATTIALLSPATLLTQTGGLIAAVNGDVAIDASLAQTNAAAVTAANGNVAITGNLGQTASSLTAGKNVTISGAVEQAAGSSVAASGDVTIGNGATQSASAITAGGSLSIVGASVTQAANSTLSATNGAYLVLTDGFAQDATSAVLVTGRAAPLLIDSTGGDIAFAGTLSGATIALNARGGSITGTLAGSSSGTLLATTLAASAAGSISLGNAANAVAAIDPVTITNANLGYNLTLQGLVAVDDVLLNDTISLAIGRQQAAALVQGADVTLTLPGPAGTLSETNSQIAATGGNVVLQAANFMAQNAATTASETVYVEDAATNLAAGTLSGGAGVVLLDGAGLTADAASRIAAGNLVLIDELSGDINIAGTVQAGNLAAGAYTGTLALIASAGSLLDSGTILAGTLTGSAAGSLALTGNANNFSAIDAFTFADQVQGTVQLAGLTAAGALTANDAASLTVGVNAANGAATISGQTVALAIGGDVTQFGGHITATNGALALTAGSLAQSLNAAINGSTGASLTLAGDLTQEAGSSITSGGDLAFSAANIQQGGAIIAAGAATIDATGDVTQASGAQLTSGGALALTANGTITQQAGATIASTGGNVTIRTGSLSQQGEIAAANQLSITGTGDFAQFNNGVLLGTNGVTLDFAGDFAQSNPGTIASAAGNIFVNAGNISQSGQIDAARTIVVSGTGGFAQSDGGTLLAGGAVAMTLGGAFSQTGGSAITAAGGNIIVQAASFDVAGNIAAPGILSFTSGSGGLTEGEGGDIEGASGVALTLAGGFTQNALSTLASQAGNVTVAAANFTQGGNITAADAINFTGAGSFLQTAGARMDAGTSLAIAAGNFSQAGIIDAVDAVNFTGPGSFLQATGARIDAGTAVAISLQTGDFTQETGAMIGADTTTDAGLLTINTGGSVSLSGTLAAGTIGIGVGGKAAPRRVTWNNNTIETGSSLPATRKVAAPITFGTGRGVFVEAGGFTQTGETKVTPLGDPRATIQITLAGNAGTVAFTPGFSTTSGLIAPEAALILDLKQNGSATGNIDVASLNVFYTGFLPPPTGFAHLTGLIAGLPGFAAAAEGFTHLIPGSRYEINNCPIQSVNCILLSPILVPLNNPVADVQAFVLRPDDDDDDLILPNVGEQDY